MGAAGLIAAPEPLRAWVHPARPDTGFVAPHDDPEALDAALAWLRERGCRRALGPVVGSTWGPYRANLGPWERPPFLGEPTFAPEPWRGWPVAARYVSLLVDGAPAVEAGRRAGERLRAEGWSLADLAALRAEMDDRDVLRAFWGLAAAAFAGAFAYTPLDLDGFAALYAPWLERAEPSLVLLARDPAGRPAGLAFAYPDAAAPELRQFVFKTLAVRPDLGGRGAGTWLVGEVHARALALGLDGGGIHALMWESAHSVRIAAGAARPLRRYALHVRELA